MTKPNKRGRTGPGNKGLNEGASNTPPDSFPLAQMLATAQLMAICAAMGMTFVQEEL